MDTVLFYFTLLIIEFLHVPQITNSATCVTSLLVNNFNVTELWKLDLIGIMDPIEQQSKLVKEQKVMQKFVDTITRDSNGRYCVELPWIQSENKIDIEQVEENWSFGKLRQSLQVMVG